MTGWKLGVHDPTMLAWVVTVGYLIVGLLCCQRGHKRQGGENRERLIWLALMVLLLGLGFNKQLDLQSLAIDLGRGISLEQGWHDQRRLVLAVFLMLVGIGTILLALFTYKHVPNTDFKTRIALVSATSLVGILCLQGISYGQLSTVLNANLLGESNAWWGVNVEEMLELALLGVIGWSAWKRRAHGEGGA